MEEGLVGETQAAKTVCPPKRTEGIKQRSTATLHYELPGIILCLFLFFAALNNLLDTTCQIISNTSVIIVFTIVSVKI